MEKSNDLTQGIMIDKVRLLSEAGGGGVRGNVMSHPRPHGESRWLQGPWWLTGRRPEAGHRPRAQPPPGTFLDACHLALPDRSTLTLLCRGEKPKDLLMTRGLPSDQVGRGYWCPKPWGRAFSSPNLPSRTAPWSEMHNGRRSVPTRRGGFLHHICVMGPLGMI